MLFRSPVQPMGDQIRPCNPLTPRERSMGELVCSRPSELHRWNCTTFKPRGSQASWTRPVIKAWRDNQKTRGHALLFTPSYCYSSSLHQHTPTTQPPSISPTTFPYISPFISLIPLSPRLSPASLFLHRSVHLQRSRCLVVS